MRRATIFLAAIGGLATLESSCAGLKQAPGTSPAPHAALEEGGFEPSDATTDGRADSDVVRDAGAEADAPLVLPSDIGCGEPWNRANKTDPNCAARSVMLVEPGVIDPDGISVAVNSAGRVAFSYGASQPEEEDLHVATFVPRTSAFQVSLATKGTFGEHLAHASAIAADPSADSFHVVYSDEESTEIHYTELTGSSSSFGQDELVASGVGADTHVAIADSETSGVFALHYAPGRNDDGGVSGYVYGAHRNSGGGFTATPPIASKITAACAPGVGTVSLAFDTNDAPHALFEGCPASNSAWVVSAAFTGATWSFPKTIDNAALNGFAGMSASVAVYGQTKYAAYFVRPASQSNPTAELRLATWVLDSDIPNITILESNLYAPAPSGGLYDLRFATAKAVDKYGLLHLVVVEPTIDNAHGLVEYLRQTVVDGQRTWLRDTVDDDALSVESPALVGIAVDAKARPHIAYRSGKDMNVYYATRFDR